MVLGLELVDGGLTGSDEVLDCDLIGWVKVHVVLEMFNLVEVVLDIWVASDSWE